MISRPTGRKTKKTQQTNRNEAPAYLSGVNRVLGPENTVTRDPRACSQRPYPLCAVAGHIEKAERVWLERSDWRGFAIVPLAAAAVAAGVPLGAAYEALVMDENVCEAVARSHAFSAVAAASSLLEWLTNRTAMMPPSVTRWRPSDPARLF
jgi:hypothetical protein